MVIARQTGMEMGMVGKTPSPELQRVIAAKWRGTIAVPRKGDANLRPVS